jgi:hypothetical protein
LTTLHAEISIVPIGTGSTGISKEVAAAFDATLVMVNPKDTLKGPTCPDFGAYSNNSFINFNKK